MKDNRQRATQAVWALSAVMLITLISVFSNYFELRLLTDIRDGMEVPARTASFNDTRQAVVGGLQLIAFIACAVFFIRWFRRAYANLHRYGIAHLEYKESMALWSFCIPFVNLVRPLRIAREIAEELREELRKLDRGYTTTIPAGLIIGWWVLFMISNVADQISLRVQLQANTITDMMVADQAYMASDLLNLPAALLAILMIRRLSADEAMFYRLANRSNAPTESLDQ